MFNYVSHKFSSKHNQAPLLHVHLHACDIQDMYICIGSGIETRFCRSEAEAVYRACGDRATVVDSFGITESLSMQLPEEAARLTYDGGQHWVWMYACITCVCILC